MTEEQKFGRPWKNKKSFTTFEAADTLRKDIVSEEDRKFDAKVKCYGDYPNYQYTVKVRETEEYFRKLSVQKEDKRGNSKKGDNVKRKEKASTKRKRD